MTIGNALVHWRRRRSNSMQPVVTSVLSMIMFSLSKVLLDTSELPLKDIVGTRLQNAYTSAYTFVLHKTPDSVPGWSVLASIMLALVIWIVGFAVSKYAPEAVDRWRARHIASTPPTSVNATEKESWGPGAAGSQKRKEVIAELSKLYGAHLASGRSTQAPIDLHFDHQRPGIVAFLDDDPLVYRRDLPSMPLAAATCIDDLLATERQVLILGDAGVGKTTLLCAHAQELLRLADAEEWRPVPVVFDLTSWSTQRLPLRDWLVYELYHGVRAPEAKHSSLGPRQNAPGVKLSAALARDALAAGQILPLLDGLSELEQGDRAACAAAIATYLEEEWKNGKYVGHVMLVVSCRTLGDWDATEQASQLGRFTLESSLHLRRLDGDQVRSFLYQGGTATQRLAETLKQNPELEGLITTFRQLELLLQVCEGDDGHICTNPQQLRDAFIQRYLGCLKGWRSPRGLGVTATAPDHPSATPDGAAHGQASPEERWLAWLAHTASGPSPRGKAKRRGSVSAEPQHTVYLEQLHVDWLPAGTWKNALPSAGLGVILLVGLASALAPLLLPAWSWVPFFDRLCGFLYGLAVGMTVGWSLRIELELPEIPRWSWKFALLGLTVGLVLPPDVALMVNAVFAVLILLVYARLVGRHRSRDQIADAVLRRSRQLRDPARFLGILIITGTLLVVMVEAILVLAQSATLDALLKSPMLADLHLDAYRSDGDWGPVGLALLARLVLGVVFAWLLGGVAHQLQGSDAAYAKDPSARPAMKMSVGQSLVNGLVGGLLAWMLVWLGVLLVTSTLSSENFARIPPALVLFVMAGATGLAFALFGGLAVVKYAILRSVLACTGVAPWRYRHFLQYAVWQGVLKREGRGYRFNDDELCLYLAKGYAEKKYAIPPGWRDIGRLWRRPTPRAQTAPSPGEPHPVGAPPHDQHEHRMDDVPHRPSAST